MFKFLASQGGLHVPLILSGPGVGPDLFIAERSFVSDVTPTLLDLAGVAPLRPAGAIPIRGLSLKGLLTPPDAEGAAPAVIPERGLGVEVSGNSAFFRGDYKIVRNMPTWGDGRWRLYNLALDPGETRDLAGEEPDVFASMLKGYETYAAAVGVLALPDNYSSQIQILINSLTRQAGFYWPYLIALLGLIILLPAGAIALWLRGRRRRSGS
jgi:arylsulfatase/uncharacterized sulfatase